MNATSYPRIRSVRMKDGGASVTVLRRPAEYENSEILTALRSMLDVALKEPHSAIGIVAIGPDGELRCCYGGSNPFMLIAAMENLKIRIFADFNEETEFKQPPGA